MGLFSRRGMGVALLVSLLMGWVGAAWGVDGSPFDDALEHFVRQQTQDYPGQVTIERLPSTTPGRSVCETPTFFAPPGRRLIGRVLVGVRCADTGTENRTYVPVRITLEGPHVVARQTLFSGRLLESQDLQVEEGEFLRPDAFVSLNDLVGKVLRQGVGAGQLVLRDMVREPYRVRQGQMVPIQAQGNGFRVSSDGQALNNGALGEVIQVKTATGRIVSGTVQADGSVAVAP